MKWVPDGTGSGGLLVGEEAELLAVAPLSARTLFSALLWGLGCAWAK